MTLLASLAFSFYLNWTISAFASESYFEVEIVEKLQSVVEKQRGQIKKLEQSNIEFKSDNEEVSDITNSSDSFTNFVSTNLRIFDLNMSFVIYIDSIYLKFVVTGK